MVFWSSLKTKIKNAFSRADFDREIIKYVKKTDTANTIITAPIINLTANGGKLELRPRDGVDCGNKKIMNVANPTAAQDVATKNYVDSGLNSYVEKNNNRDVAIQIENGGESYFNFNKIQPNQGYRNWTGLKFNIKNGSSAQLSEVFKLFFKDTNEGVFLKCENNKLSFTDQTYIKNVKNPTDAQDVATKNYVDDAITPYVKKTNTANTIITAPIVNITANGGNIELRPRDNIDCGNKKIVNVANPVNPTDAVNKSYVDNGYYRKGNIPTPTGANDAVNKSYVDNGYYRKGNIPTPTGANDAVNKQYVDNAISNIPSSGGFSTYSTYVGNMRRITNSSWGVQRHYVFAENLATFSGEVVSLTPFIDNSNNNPNICVDCRYDRATKNIYLHIYRIDGTSEISNFAGFGVVVLFKK